MKKVSLVFVSIILLSFFSPVYAASPGTACVDAQAAIETARRATLTVRIAGPDGEDETIGAGFIETTSGRIVTNAHVVGGADTVRVGTADGRIVSARVVARDRRNDVALLDADLPGLPRLAFADALPEIGATVYALGSPFGLGQSVTRGIVSALDRGIDANTPYGMIQHDAPLNPGSSGGPVIDQNGRVIGINTAMPDGFRRDVGIAYAIPAAIAAKSVRQLAGGNPAMERPLGVSIRALSPRLAAAVGATAERGVLVESVAPGSAADGAGIVASDIIVTIAGNPIGELRDVAVALNRADPAATVPVEVLRGAQTLTVVLPKATPEPPPKAPPRLRGGAKPVAAADLGFTLPASGAAEVTDVAKRSAAATAGLAAGDTILAVGRTGVASSAEAWRLIGDRVSAPFALLVADAGGATRYVVLDPWVGGLDGDGLNGNMRHPRSARF
jgi:S1-C subfamily serine protease